MEEIIRTDSVELVRIARSESSYIAQVQNTYTASFPQVERRDFSLFCRLIEEEAGFSLFVILKNQVYVGFLTCWDFPEFVYVEHFAIDEASRGGGIGSACMSEWLTKVNRPVVLEVEEMVDELTRRRVVFYENLGFSLFRQPYLQPPYRAGSPWCGMRLMSFGEVDREKNFRSIKELLYRNVYGVSVKRGE